MRGIRHHRLGPALVVAALIGAACAGGDDGATSAPDATEPAPEAVAPAATTTSPSPAPSATATGTTVPAAAPTPTTGPASAPAPMPAIEADEFTSDGDPIAGWYWLRDPAGEQSGQWVFSDLPGAGPFELSLELLATDTVNGGPGYPARFWLTYGPVSGSSLGAATDDVRLVELPNVSPPSDPVGYTTRGTTTLPAGAVPADADGLWVRISRVGPNGETEPYHVAVNDTSVMLAAAPCEPGQGDTAEEFASDGDLIAGWYWLRDPAGEQSGQWVFRNTADTGTFVLDLELLATDTFNGGRGFPARFWLTYGAAGDDLGPAADDPLFVELPNVSPPSDPVGYTTRGTVTLTTGALPHWADGIWVRITRAAPEGRSERSENLEAGTTGGGVEPYHIAVNATSVVLRASSCDGSDGIDGTVPPSTRPPGTTPPSSSSTTSSTSTSTTTTTLPPPDLDDLPPMIISLGDSYISGEAGRWAGNTYALIDWPFTDALSTDAYHDVAGREQISGCHRSESAAIHIGTAEDGTPVASVNLACSGARTYSRIDPDTGARKPGVDRCTSAADATESNQYDWVGGKPLARPYNCNGITGQVELLRQKMLEVKGRYHVEMVVVSIGGNNFQFGDIVEQCVMDFLKPRVYLGCTCIARILGTCVFCVPFYGEEDHCSDDTIASNVTSPESLASRRAEITAALDDIRRVMNSPEIGYTDADWTLLVHTYPSPIPGGDEFRYIETGYSRFAAGGCGFWNEDADWANNTALPNIAATVRGAVSDLGVTNAKVLDLTAAFIDRRLCEDDVGQVGPTAVSEGKGVVGSWTWPNAVNLSEWVQQIRGILSEGGKIDVPPFIKEESFHPNYWGQLALRSCVRQAYNNGNAIGGRCVRAGNGLTSLGEPRMDVVP